MFSKGMLRLLCHLWSLLQCYSPRILSSYNLWMAALLSVYPFGLGARAKRKSLRVPSGKHFPGVCFIAGAPPAAHVGALPTHKTRISVPDTHTYSGHFSSDFSILCFWSFPLWKSPSRRPTFECQVLVLTCNAHSPFPRRPCCSMALPRNAVHCQRGCCE